MIERTILSNLVYNEPYTRKVLPFIKSDYFVDNDEKFVFETIESYINQYNGLPTKEALHIAIGDSEKLNEDRFKKISTIVESLNFVENSNTDWLMDRTEKFCQDKAIYNAVRQAILVLDGKDKENDKGAIPKILTDALSISFDSSIGHDYTEDFGERYDFYHTKEDKVEFDLEIFNKITKGGVSRKSLIVALAGCVHPDTEVTIRYRKK